MSSKHDPERQNEDPIGRRGFFTEGFRHMLRPIANLVERRIEEIRPSFTERRDTSSASIDARYWEAPPLSEHQDGDARYLRPPGALPEEEFLSTCTTSGRCVEACPIAAIRPAWSGDPRLDRKPVIEARLQACVVCEDLACMQVCPSGALEPRPREEIRMGTAVVDLDTCVRSQGEDCQICVDKCPIGPRAIDVPELGGEIVVNAEACVGCGVCEMYCPTDPRAITVEPREPISG